MNRPDFTSVAKLFPKEQPLGTNQRNAIQLRNVQNSETITDESSGSKTLYIENEDRLQAKMKQVWVSACLTALLSRPNIWGNVSNYGSCREQKTGLDVLAEYSFNPKRMQRFHCHFRPKMYVSVQFSEFGIT